MKKKFLLIVLFIVFYIPVSWANQDSAVFAAEEFILNNEIDSAKASIENIKGYENKEIRNICSRIVNKDNLTYSEYKVFVESIYANKIVDPVKLSEFIETCIPIPSGGKLNYDFVRIKWMQIYGLLNEPELDKAAEIQKELEGYVSRFNAKDSEVKRAKILVDAYYLVIYQINLSADKADALIAEDRLIVEKIKDTNLLILLNFFKADFLIGKGELDEFIKISEESLWLDSQLAERSYFYQSTVLHLIDAYFYKGGKEQEALKLLDELYDNPHTRSQTYSYYPSYLANIEVPSAESEAIFKKFGVDSMLGFAEKILKISKTEVNSNEYYYVLYMLSVMFEKHHDLEHAIWYTRESNQVIKKTYSTELAESLAAQETKLLQQKQELILAKEQDKSKMFLIISVLTGLIAVLSISYLLLRKNKERQLELKNNEITKQRDEIKKKDAEKAILLREIHHRVKNNFQVVSSLLELQAVGIEDKKAKALALEGKNRINSMALIHKKLYENDDLQMFFDDYIKKLVSDLSQIFGKAENLQLVINVPHVAFDVDTAIPLGLIINELVTNALKYGLNNNSPKLEVTIAETESDLYLLHVKDNGTGLPGGLDIKKYTSLGLQLVNGLSKQLQGDLSYKNENGAHFLVSFKDTHGRAAIE